MTAPTQATAREAVELPPLPEPLEIVWPEMHQQALGCGVEDRGIRDRYQAAEYGWQVGVDRAIECVPEGLYDAEQMHAYALSVSAAKQEEVERLMGDLRSSDEHRLELQKGNLLLAEEVDKMREALKDILKKPWPVTNGVSDFQAFRANELFIAELKQIARAALSPSQQGEPR